jgi:hypothetical protein
LKDRNITVNIFYDLFEENRRDNCDVYKIAIYLIIMKSSFLSEYKDYGDIFSLIEYTKIAENPQTAYTIDLEEDIITFYKLIYHFSEKKLRVLREYLEEN